MLGGIDLNAPNELHDSVVVYIIYNRDHTNAISKVYIDENGMTKYTVDRVGEK